MIPILYSQEEKQFASNGLGRLIDSVSCTVSEEENGAYTLSMEYPSTGLLANELQLERIISVKPYDGAANRQAFRISNIRKNANDVYSIEARHISYQRSYIPVGQFTATNLGEAIAKLNAFSSRYEPNPFTITTTIPASDEKYGKPFAITEPMSLGTILMDAWKGNVVDEFDEDTGEQEDKGGLQKIYGGTYEWDNWNIKLLQNRGSDNGVTIRYGKNLVDLDQEEAIDDMITGILPIYNDSEEGLIVCDSIVYTEGHNNYPYNKTVIVDIASSISDEDRYKIMKDDPTTETQEVLIAAAQKYIADNKLGSPTVTLTVSFQNLADTEEYKNIAPLENVQLGDTVTIVFERLNISKKARVVSYEYDVLREKYNTITLGDYRDSWVDGIISDAKNTEIAIKNASRALTSSYKHWYTTHTGWLTDAQGTVVPVQNSDGTWSELLFLNAPTTGEATQVMRINRNGIGFASGSKGTFGSWTYDQAWTIDGVLTLGGTRIFIQDGNEYRTGAGRLEILNSSGELIGRWDENGILAECGTFKGTVYAANGEFTGKIVSTSGTIGGITIGDNSLYSEGANGRFTINKDGSITHSFGSMSTTLHGGVISLSDGSSNTMLTQTGIVVNGGSLFGTWTNANTHETESGISVYGDIWLNGNKLDFSNLANKPHSSALVVERGPAISDAYSGPQQQGNGEYYDVQETPVGDIVYIGHHPIISYDWMSNWISPNLSSLPNGTAFSRLADRVSALEGSGGGSSSTPEINIAVTRNEKESLYFGNSFWSASYIFGGNNAISYNTYHVYLNESSDERLKNIDCIHGDISKFYMGLKPIEFEYKPGLYDRKEPIKFYGFSAQNIEAALSDAGFESCNRRIVYDTKPDEEAGETNYIDPEDTVKYIQKEELHAFHVAMIQQQEKRIETLENENNELRSRLDILESLISNYILSDK